MGGCEQHAHALFACKLCGLEVGDNDYLLADKLLRLIFLADAGNYLSAAHAVIEGELEQAVRLLYGYTVNDLAHSEIHLAEIVDGHLGLEFRNGSSFLYGSFFGGLLGCKLGLGCGGGEIEQVQIAALVDSMQEEVESGTLFLIEQQAVNILEEGGLLCFYLLVVHLGEELTGNCIEESIEFVKGVVTLGKVSMQYLDSLLFELGEAVVNLKIAGLTQMISVLGRALLKPELCKFHTLGKILLLVGGAYLFKHLFKCIDVEVNSAAQLDQLAHRNGFYFVTLNGSIIHDGREMLIGLAAAVSIERLIKLKVLAENAVIKAEIERLERLGLGIEPKDNFGLIELEQSFGGEVETGGAGHFAGLALDSDKLITGEVGLGVVEYLVGDDAAGLIAAHRSCVILAAGLEVYAFSLPAHRPVDLPGKLGGGSGEEIIFALMTALAGVVTLGAVLREAVEHGGILAAYGAVNDCGGISLALAFLRVLGAEAVEDIKDLAAVLDGVNDSLVISAGAVFLCLISEINVDAELSQRTLKFLLEMLGIACVAAKGIGNINVGQTDILAPLLGNVLGHLAEAVELIPGKEQLCFLSCLDKGAADEIAGCYIAEVADMNRAGGADAGSADIFLLVRLFCYDFLCYGFGPMHNSRPFLSIYNGLKMPLTGGNFV